MNDDTVPGQLEEIHQRLKAGDERMAGLERQVAENTALTRENTAITRDIKDLLDAARLGFKVLGGLGVFIKWAGGIAAGLAALWALIHHGPKP